jgi:hypothetical protein
MDVATIKMPKEEARAKLAEYRRGLHRRADAEWERAALAYEAAALGKPLLVLSAVIAQAPRDEKGRPRLAIARADQRQVQYYRHRDWAVERFSIPGARPRLRDARISVPVQAETPAFLASNPRWPWECEGYALVPLVPPDVRRGHDLSRRFILWEVEQWSDAPLGAVPDRDPYLLQRIADDLYAVVGEWDLTEVERAVMRDRARR